MRLGQSLGFTAAIVPALRCGRRIRDEQYAAETQIRCSAEAMTHPLVLGDKVGSQPRAIYVTL